jgi:hypothetical protein
VFHYGASPPQVSISPEEVVALTSAAHTTLNSLDHWKVKLLDQRPADVQTTEFPSSAITLDSLWQIWPEPVVHCLRVQKTVDLLMSIDMWRTRQPPKTARDTTVVSILFFYNRCSFFFVFLCHFADEVLCFSIFLQMGINYIKGITL